MPRLSVTWMINLQCENMLSLHLHFLRDIDLTATAPWKALVTSLGVLFAAWIVIVVKRLYFHPLSKIPGPKLAAATSWYECYYDCIRSGDYSHQFPRFHEKYASSIIRIAPDHVHINDSDFFNVVFGSQSEFYKAEEYDNTGLSGGLLTMRDPHKHKIRRNMLNPLFSARSIDGVSSRTTRTVQRALEIVVTDTQAGKVINIHKLFQRIMFDNLCGIAFGHSYNSLEDGEEETEFLTQLDKFTMQAWTGKHFPIIIKLSLNLPYSIAKRIASGYLQFRAQCADWVTDVIERRNREVPDEKFELKYAFDLLLEPQPVKNHSVPNREELVDEAVLLVFAGTDTTTYATTTAMFHILTHSDVLKRLQDELQRALHENGGQLEWASIRQLPYLAAIVQETLRLSPPAPGPLARNVPPQGTRFGSLFLPGGTTLSISHYLIHQNPRHFPEPSTFNPDRWLGEEGKSLRKWNVAFSSGTRSCIGINLAYQEIYLTLALFFAKFEMELLDTDPSSIEWEDYGAAKHKRPVKIKVKSILT